MPPGFRVSINIYNIYIYIARPFPFSCCHPVRTESFWRCTSSHSKEKWGNHFPFSWARQGHSLMWEEEREEIVVRSSSIVSTSSTHSFLSLSPVPHGIFVGLLPIIVTHREAVQVPELPTLPEHGSEKLGIFFFGTEIRIKGKKKWPFFSLSLLLSPSSLSSQLLWARLILSWTSRKKRE